MSMSRNRRPGKSAAQRTARSSNSPQPGSAGIVPAGKPAVVRPRLLDRAIALLAGGKWHATAASILYLAVLLAVSLRYLLFCLSRSWFFSSDEYVFAAEVIRFLNLDWHQHYFDMPGTPFMMLSAILWAAFYPVQTWFNPDPAATSVTAFTYSHLDWFFTLLRCNTIFFWAVSIVLLFLLSRKLLNTVGAWAACLVLAMSPIYAKYSGFCRVESMAICLAIIALLVTYRALEKRPSGMGSSPSWRDPMILAGALVGVAAAARLHSITASLPLLLLVLLFDERMPRRVKYPRWVLSAGIYLVPAMFVVGALCCWWARSWVAGELPHAASLLTKAGIVFALAPVAAALLYRFERARPILLRVASPEAIKIAMGCCGGFLLANFTVVPQRRFFLGSVEMYMGSYLDWQRTTWPLWTNIRWVARFYLNVFAPDTILVVLLAVSIVWIVAARDRRVLPYLIVLAGFFISKPLNTIAAPHHVLLWLPCFALVCAFPVAKLYSLAAGASGYLSVRRLAATGAAGVLLAVVALHLTAGPRQAGEYARLTQVRLENVSAATDYLKYRTPLGSEIAMSYFCFNPDIFYMWTRSLEVPVPQSEFDSRRYFTWWGKKAELQGIAGYACTTGGDRPGLTENNKLTVADPNQVADTYHDPDFQRVASFGKDADEVDLFRFDFRTPAGKPR